MLGVRLNSTTEKALEALARRTRRSKSDIAREAITRHVERHDEAFLAEARRQSLCSASRDDPEEWRFLESLEADDDGWK